MKKFLKIFIVLISLQLLLTNLYSSGHGGASGVQQRITIDAKLLGLANAYDAISYDCSSIYYNSAGLIDTDDPVLFVSYMPVWDNLTDVFFIGTKFRVGSLPLGLGIMNIGSSGIKERDDSPEVKSLIEYKDISCFISSAYEFLPDLSIGIRAGLYFQKIINYNDWGIGLDFSLLWRVTDPYKFTKSKIMRFLNLFSFGVIVYNVLPPKIKLAYKSVSMPLMVKSSISYRFPVLWDFLSPELGFGLETIPVSESSCCNAGLEFTLWKFFYIRAGYKITDKVFTVGSGIDMLNITIDYGLTPIQRGINYYTLNLKIKF